MSLGKEAVLAASGRAGEQHYVFSILRILQFSLDSVQEGLHLKGLLKRAVGAQHFGDVEKIEHADHVTATGDHNDFHVGEFPSQRNGGLQAILIGHKNVHNDEIRWGQSILLEGLLPITRFRDVIANLLQCFANQMTDLVFVIDDKNRWHPAPRLR